MNRNLIVTIVVVLIIAGASGYYFMSRSGNAPVNPEIQSPSVSPLTTTEKTSIKNFMAMAGTQKCDFADPETGSFGTVYLDSGKMRGDFSSNINGQAMSSHMINDGEDIYIWIDDQATGFKTSLSSIEEMSKAEGATRVNQIMDINREVDYKCESWGGDQVKFAVPVEVKFQDMGEMMKNMQSGAPAMENHAQACAACNNLDGDAQVQCKRALKCN